MLYKTENWNGLYGKLESEVLAWTPGFKNIHTDIEMNIIVNECAHTQTSPLYINLPKYLPLLCDSRVALQDSNGHT